MVILLWPVSTFLDQLYSKRLVTQPIIQGKGRGPTLHVADRAARVGNQRAVQFSRRWRLVGP